MKRLSRLGVDWREYYVRNEEFRSQNEVGILFLETCQMCNLVIWWSLYVYFYQNCLVVMNKICEER